MENKLYYAPYFPHVISLLELLPRTGWVQWNIDDPENVWDHILSVRILAIEYRDKLGLSDDEFIDLLKMIEIHDWPEALVGDAVILGDEPNVDELRREKKQREIDAMKKLCQGHELGLEIFSLYQRYSFGTDKVARLVKQLEKLQAVFKAAEYEERFEKMGITDEFIHYTKDLIHDSFLVSEFQKIGLNLLVLGILFNRITLLYVT